MFYVYLLKSKIKPAQLYVGYSANLKNRISEHNNLKSPATRPYVPMELIFYEAYKEKSDAKRREKYFKTSPGRKSLKLIIRDNLSSKQN
ncbi:MAG: GIY-YIG nuclease family protein [Patescibacteria group bacterium]